jgi:hypothetical protein
MKTMQYEIMLPNCGHRLFVCQHVVNRLKKGKLKCPVCEGETFSDKKVDVLALGDLPWFVCKLDRCHIVPVKLATVPGEVAA